jgi:hypothetical protein
VQNSNAGDTPAVGRSYILRPMPHDDVDIQYVTTVVSNWTGREFIISMVQARPPAWGDPRELPDEIPGKVMCRVALSAQAWEQAVQTFVGQLHDIRTQATVSDQQERAVDRG